MDIPGLAVIAASLSLVALTIALAWWLRLDVSRDIVVAVARAALQLLAVGAVFTWIFASSGAMVWAWLWVGVMITVATLVIRRRAKQPIGMLVPLAALTLGASTGISLAITFGFGVIPLDPVALVVIAGITTGNAMPMAVLGANQATSLCRDNIGEIEAALALGFDRRQVLRFMAPRAARSALIPQIERTKVVGLIALPGAMTGLLLGGVDPVDAVVIQLLVMYLVLGTATLCVVTVVTAIVSAATTPDLRLAPWTGRSPG